MKSRRTCLLVLACIIAEVGVAAAAPRQPLRVVLWLGGFAHQFEDVAAVLGKELPRQHPMTIHPAWNGDFLDDPRQPDVILMYHCHESAEGVLTEARKNQLLAMIRQGVGVVALHASYYSFVNWDEYHQLFGARFIKHGKSEARLRVTPVQQRHPILLGIDKPLEIVSELYQSTPLPQDCNVLAHSRELDQGEPQPSVWTRAYGRGRVVTILPGHFADNFRQADFQRLILNSLAWAAEADQTTTNATSQTASLAEQKYDWEQSALDAFKVPEGFEISLVAAEPHLANPISMTLDEQGRIYVSNAHSYRQKWWLMKPPPAIEPSNPIVRLTPGPTGRAVRAQLVAEGFEHPVMGLAIRSQRLWAANLNQVFATDLDEEGRMVGDRKILVRDAATPWNPFGMYRLVRGPDDLLYLTIGDHATQLAGVAGKSAVRLDGNGSGSVFRFRDDGTSLQLLLEGMRAPFTLGFTPFGDLWVITNGEGSPNCLLDAVPGTDYRFRNQGPNDWSWLTGANPLAAPAWENPPGAHTAVLPYYSSAFPDHYWGNLFVSNFGVHGEPAKRNEVLRLIVDDFGQVVRSEPFITSSDPRFRPTQVSLAPDGSLYMLDWYGKDDENDLTGRLYRIRYTGQTTSPSPIGLGSRNHMERERTKTALLAAGPIASLPTIIEALSGTDALAATEALWTLRRSGWTSAAEHIRTGFLHEDWRVRRLAIQHLRELGIHESADLHKPLSDPEPAVQVEAAFGFRDAVERVAGLARALRGGAAKPRRLRFMAALEIARYGREEDFTALLADGDPDVRTAGLIALDEAFYESSKGFKTPRGETQAQLAELTQRIASLEAELRGESSRQLAAGEKWEAETHEQLARLERERDEISARGIPPALTASTVLARFIAEPQQLDTSELLDLARRWPHDGLQAAVNGLVKTQLGSANVSAAEFARGLDALRRMGLPTNDAAIATARIQLLDRATGNDIRDEPEKLALLQVLAADNARAEDLRLLKRFAAEANARVRAEACRLIGTRHAGDEEAVAFCREAALNEAADLARRLDALVTLATLETTPRAESWTELLLSPRREIVLASLRSLQASGDRAAARAIVGNTAAQLRQRHGSAIAADLDFTIAALEGEVSLDKQLGDSDIANLRRQVLAENSAGCAELGRLVFRMRTCYKCHVAGEAQVRAPLLDQIAATHDATYLVDSILDPNKAVKTGFLTQMIVLDGGEIVTGTLNRNVSGEGRYDEIIDSEGRRQLIDSRRIVDVKAVSAMPTGLAATMSPTELLDLLAYLQTLK